MVWGIRTGTVTSLERNRRISSFNMEVFINKKFIFASRDPEEKVLKKATVAHLAFNKKNDNDDQLRRGKGGMRWI